MTYCIHHHGITLRRTLTPPQRTSQIMHSGIKSRPCTGEAALSRAWRLAMVPGKEWHVNASYTCSIMPPTLNDLSYFCLPLPPTRRISMPPNRTTINPFPHLPSTLTLQPPSASLTASIAALGQTAVYSLPNSDHLQLPSRHSNHTGATNISSTSTAPAPLAISCHSCSPTAFHSRPASCASGGTLVSRRGSISSP